MSNERNPALVAEANICKPTAVIYHVQSQLIRLLMHIPLSPWNEGTSREQGEIITKRKYCHLAKVQKVERHFDLEAVDRG